MYLRCPECKTRYEIAATSIPDGGARVRCPRCRTVFGVTRPDAAHALASNPGAAHPAAARPQSPHSLAGAVSGSEVIEGDASLATAMDDPAADAFVAEVGFADTVVTERVAAAPPGGAVSNGRAARLDAPESEDDSVAPPDADTLAAATAAPLHEPALQPDVLVDEEPVLRRRSRVPGAGGRPMPPAANAVVPGAPVEADVARRIARALVSEVLLARRELRNEALREGLLLARLGPAILDAWDRYRERVGAPVAEGTRFFNEAVNDILGDGQAIL